MKNGKHITLGIESSCDETAIGIVADGREVLANVISSQIDIHTAFGGVVPEIASRRHLENINGVLSQALEEAQITINEVDLVGVTYGPGLVGALLVGKIINHKETPCQIAKLQEKGYFAYGGSTVILLLRQGAMRIDEDIRTYSARGIETKVSLGEKIGAAK